RSLDPLAVALSRREPERRRERGRHGAGADRPEERLEKLARIREDESDSPPPGLPRPLEEAARDAARLIQEFGVRQSLHLITASEDAHAPVRSAPGRTAKDVEKRLWGRVGPAHRRPGTGRKGRFPPGVQRRITDAMAISPVWEMLSPTERTPSASSVALTRPLVTRRGATPGSPHQRAVAAARSAASIRTSSSNCPIVSIPKVASSGISRSNCFSTFKITVSILIDSAFGIARIGRSGRSSPGGTLSVSPTMR